MKSLWTGFLAAVSFSLMSVCGASHAGPPAHAASHGQLPPGLQKRAAEGKGLPPGWRKKLHPGTVLDPHVYAHRQVLTGPDYDGLMTIRVDNEIIRLVAATHEIVEILSR
ncbi:MAG: hypothetical protein EVA65_13670 [Oceanococcus sp.]|nr:MAG: hypothetical protein EVA65_13670 [Oceanococcus sp.]